MVEAVLAISQWVRFVPVCCSSSRRIISEFQNDSNISYVTTHMGFICLSPYIIIILMLSRLEKKKKNKKKNIFIVRE